MTTTLVDLQALVQEARSLDPLPASAVRLARLAAPDEPDLAEMVEVVRLDEALTGRLLAAANAVVGGARCEIASVDQAVLRLGPPRVLGFAVASAARGRMQSALPEYGLDEGELWRHSVASALAAERAHGHCRRPLPGHAFTAALLHDVGKLVLARHLHPAALAELRRVRDERGISLEEAEHEVLHASHGSIGALVARAWSLPECIAVGIRYHHHPLSAPDEAGRLLCHVIALADAVVDRIGLGGREAEAPFDGSLAGFLAIPRQAFDELCREVEADVEAVLRIYA